MTTTTRTITSREVPAPGRYRIDPTGSTIQFATRHLFGLARVRGTFPLASGAIAASEPICQSTVHVEVDATGFRTRSRRRDTVVCGPRFLDTARYPTITFRGTGVDLDEAGATVAGALTVRDVTRPMTLRLTGWDLPDQDGGALAIRARATARIDRRAFDISASRGMAARYLDVTIQIACLPN